MNNFVRDTAVAQFMLGHCDELELKITNFQALIDKCVYPGKKLIANVYTQGAYERAKIGIDHVELEVESMRKLRMVNSTFVVAVKVKQGTFILNGDPRDYIRRKADNTQQTKKETSNIEQ